MTLKPSPFHAAAASALAARYARIRDRTVALTQPLSEADCTAQSMADASPAKWHLAHVTWFFETFVLERFEPAFAPFHPRFRVLFNSYYNAVGEQHARPERGLITRPGLAEVLAYRANVDDRMQRVLASPHPGGEIESLVELGLQHEQQHQELLLTDLKHLLSRNPLAPAYRGQWRLQQVADVRADWLLFDGGEAWIGHDGDGFGFDNEGPRHRVLLRPYGLSSRLVTHGDWTAFIDDGGYADPRWWLSAGWDWVRATDTSAPLYWRRNAGAWLTFTLHGLVHVDPHTPVTHISLYEADAYAHWAAAQSGRATRLPTEDEWEHAARVHHADPGRGNFAEHGTLHPMPLARAHDGPMQMFGDVWEWTRSAYTAYPGFKPWAGAVGEYNGKFMINQYVLRGGSCVTPREHIRASYRNFFPAQARWQFSGLRLACDLD